LGDIYEKVGGVLSIAKDMIPGGVLQMTTANIRGNNVRVFKNMPPAVGDLYRSFLSKHASKDFICFGDERYSFGEVEAQMDALGAELIASFGVRRGDRVAIAMRNLPEFMIAFLGISACGAVAVPLNSLLGGKELEYALKDSGSKVVIADAPRLKSCLPFLAGSGIQAILCRGDEQAAGDFGSVASWAEVVAAGKARQRPSTEGIAAEDDAMIMYTSGSTGHPKGVVHTQRSVGTSIMVGELASRMVTETDARKALLAVPLFHITALALVFLWCLSPGVELHIMQRWDPGVALDIIERHRITRFTGVPTMVRDMIEHPTFAPERVASIKAMSAGGAPVPPSQVAKLHARTSKANSSQGYGLTEAHLVTSNKGVDYLKHPTSCGRPIPLLVECKVVDPDTGKQLKDGQRGELIVRSAMVMRGYHNRPEDTAKAIDKDGFFHTGDIAKMEGGFVYILDRLKDMIIRGGENIDCSEVEAALYSHPAVRECSVFGLPDERLGEVVGAAVWWEGEKPPAAAELSAHVAAKLAKFKVPLPENIFLHSDELPKGATGKLDKKGLREQYSSAATRGPPMSKL